MHDLDPSYHPLDLVCLSMAFDHNQSLLIGSASIYCSQSISQMLEREMKREKNLEARSKELKQKAKRDAALKKDQTSDGAQDANADMPEVTPIRCSKIQTVDTTVPAIRALEGVTNAQRVGSAGGAIVL